MERTLSLLRRLPEREDGRYDGSPRALSNLLGADRQAAFTPPPDIVPVSDILFDAWALTSVREKMPGRPPVNDWLHGVVEWELPETHVAWREEVDVLADLSVDSQQARDFLEDYPVKPHERLRDQTKRVFGHLKKLAEKNPKCPAWIVDSDGSVRATTLRDLAEDGEDALNHMTVLLSHRAGGLENGILDGSVAFDAARDDYDVADRAVGADGTPLRGRVWDDEEPPVGMRCVRTIDTKPDRDSDEDADADAVGRRFWRWYVRPRAADDDGSKTARSSQDLDTHLLSAKGFAGELVGKLALGKPEASAVRFAAQWHDRGKARAVWQRSIGNRDFPATVLAKSGGKMRPIELSGYRHELGSLLDVLGDPEFRGLEANAQDLVLHAIAAHHGRARPHFPLEEAFDPKHSEEAVRAIVREVPRRFARLQRRYGRWGLAYLESLVRVADIAASQEGNASAAPAKETT